MAHPSTVNDTPGSRSGTVGPGFRNPTTPGDLPALDQPKFTVGTDDRVALFPQTVLALRAATRPQLINLASQGSRKRYEVRSALTDSLDWAGDDRWLLVNNLQALLEAHVRSVD
mgnify:CR=1 FL=1